MERSFVTINLENLYNQLDRMPTPAELATALSNASGESVTPLMAIGYIKSLQSLGYLKFNNGNYEIVKTLESLPMESKISEPIVDASPEPKQSALNDNFTATWNTAKTVTAFPEIKAKPKSWIRRLLDRAIYYSIGFTDLCIGAVAFGMLGHTELTMIVLSFFGAVITFGRVNLYRTAISEPKGTKRNILFSGWIIGIALATFFCVSLEVTTIEAQNAELSQKVALYSQEQERGKIELALLAPRIEKLSQDIATVNRSWDNRTVDIIRSELKEARERKTELDAILKKESPASRIQAVKMFSVLFGEEHAPMIIRIMMILLQVFMELYLAVFSVRLSRKEGQGE